MTFPTLQSITPSSFGSAATSHAAAMPPAIAVGDLLACLFVNAGSNILVTAPTGWTRISSMYRGLATSAVLLKISDGTEVGTTPDFVTGTAQKACCQVHRISGFYGAPITATPDSDGYSSKYQQGTDAAPAPGTFSPVTWSGPKDLLWIAWYAAAGRPTLNSIPTGFTDSTYTESDTGAGAVSMGSARKYETLDYLDPDNFGVSASVDWVARTLALRPPDSDQAGGTSTSSPRRQRSQPFGG